MSSNPPLSAPGILGVQGATLLGLRNSGLVPICDGAALLGGQSTFTSPSAAVEYTNRIMHRVTADASDIVFVYANFINNIAGQLNWNYNPVWVGCSAQAGSNVADTALEAYVGYTMDGAQIARVDPGAYAFFSIPNLSVTAGQYLWENTLSHAIMPAAPSAPTLATASTSSGLPASTSYGVIITYVYADGTESATSANTSITTGATANNSITVTSPAVSGGAIGYRVYISGANATITATTYYAPPWFSWTFPIGVNAVIVNPLSSNNKNIRFQAGWAAMPVGGAGAGGTSQAGRGTAEGRNTGNTLSDTTKNSTNNVNWYRAVAILGRVRPTLISAKAAIPPTVGLIGDSVMSATGDHGFVGVGGFGIRALRNMCSTVYDPTISPLFGHTINAVGGDTLAQYAGTAGATRYERSHHNLASLCSNVICEYGINDYAAGLTTAQANLLIIATWYLQRGIKFFQTTLTPKTLSTDGWTSVANQSAVSYEAYRQGFNAWVRDTSAAGFVAQASAAAGVSSSMVAVIDCCKYVEVNSSNVLTQNGGFWLVPSQTPLLSGTLTSTSGGNTFGDTSQSMTNNAYAGYSILMTSGAAVPSATQAGQTCIGWNSSNTFASGGPTIGGISPSIGDSYQIRQIMTIDGLHPSSFGHMLLGQPIIEASSQFI